MSGAAAHPMDEVCDPAELPTPFCLALSGQLEIEEPPTLGETLTEYLGLGYVHILPAGMDHILFVLALFLAAQTWGVLLWQVTTFTVAHSVTLGLAAVGLTSPGGTLVEVLIAASIAFVAVENLWLRGRPVPSWRYLVVFAFGLLHGLGFAGVLLELGMPDEQLVAALVAFNVGVELGQLTVVAAALLLGWVLLRKQLGQERYVRWFTLPSSVVIGLIGAYWAVTRL
ncbi:MAG: HupE/UreJ family protein [Pseudomonadota bacterium]